MTFSSTKRIMNFQEDYYAMAYIAYLYQDEAERSLIKIDGDES